MKAVGVVVEYNPFHNGHFYHISQSKSKTQADVVIAVMSGQFLQRGEPALVSKYHRTKMALMNGVDLVIELPYVYSTAHATLFAEGAIQLLDAIGCKSFAFGSEEGSISPFLNTFDLIHKQNEHYNSLIKQYVTTGISYPQSLFKAYEELRQKESAKTIDLSQPNNILGYHYIEAAKRLNLAIEPITIPRIQAGFHEDINPDSSIASATGIRKAIAENDSIENIKQFVPQHTFNELESWMEHYHTFISWEKFWPYLKYAILRNTPQQLSQYADVNEGIEFALIKAAKRSNSFNELMNAIKSKRYTWTRLQRMVTHIYTGITKEALHQFTNPTYIRLLGMSQNGQAYLSQHKKEFSLPLISRVASTKDDAMLSLDVHATDMYALGVELATGQKIATDYQTPPIRM
ncbi:nucleotidyltransferase [Lysinibacillus yapensis]|uniref:tRNA(Met) cytidine acetate ligase n=1 Tax=Ureibacillus yapensis TaxID=2304605 RepID=A0A396SDN8_9BACL|nr:nucleotidyltransferase [Lysinibacillus yapensis]RHW39750.1 nucleotidyltransferase [Lysinibacillus yapensis]